MWSNSGNHQSNNDILKEEVLLPLKDKLLNEEFVIVGNTKTVELLNKSITFNGNEDGMFTIPGFTTSKKYVEHELKWYKSQNPHIEEISNHAKMWGDVADDNGMANSNYGYLIYSPQNGYQYKNVLQELRRDPQSRRAVMYYSNPFIHYTGGKDYICTVFVSYLIRDNKLHCVVNMRSNDVRFGLVGADLAWQTFVLKQLANDLDIEVGTVGWHAVSLHIYERHFNALREIK